MTTRRAVRPFLLLVAAALGFAAGPLSPASADAAADLEEARRLVSHTDPHKQLKGLEILAKQPRGPDPEAIALTALESKDWEVQIHAALTLGRVGEAAAQKALTKVAISGDIQWIRDAAVQVLPGFDKARITESLLFAAKSRKLIKERVHALQAAAHTVTIDDLKKLRSLAKQKDSRVTAAAIRAIGFLMDDEAGRPLAQKSLVGYLKLRSARKHFRAYVEAIRGLGRHDAPEIHDLLLDELLRQPDEDPYLPERVARLFEPMQAEGIAAALGRAIGNTKGATSLTMLVRLAGRLRARGTRDALVATLAHKDERVRSTATKALGLLGDPASIDVLKTALDDKSPFVRSEAVTSLRRLQEPAGFFALGAKLANDKEPGVRLQYVVDVAELGKHEGLVALAPFTQDKSWRVKTAAVVSVGTLGDGDDYARIAPFAESKDWKVRGAAFEAFGRLRATKSIPKLIEGLKDKDPVVRGVCLSNLQVLSGKRLGTKTEMWIRWWQKEGKTLKLRKRSLEKQAEGDGKSDEEAPAPKKPNPDDRYADPSRRYGDPPDRDKGIDVLKKARILVIKGAWDKVEVVLQHLRIRHTPLRAQELKDVGLNPNQIVLVNCEGNMDKRTIERVQWFVNIGGYLMSTDWALTKAVRVAFPGYIRQFARSSTGNDVVVVEDAAPHHPLNAGVFNNVPALKWWLEIQAFPITISYPERCQILVDSAEMRERYGSSPMAAVFRWGLGKVQHSISHFYLQEEGMQHLARGKERKVFAADNLGLSLAQIRKVERRGGFDGALNDATMKEIAPDYSMFRLIVNMVREKKEWVENL